MTKLEIITLAARSLGDTSTAFINDAVRPFFELVLLDLANYQCIEPLRRSFDFHVIADKRGYSVKEITKQTPHPVMKAERVLVYEWGASNQPCLTPDSRFEEIRLREGEAARGKWKAWRLFPNSDNLEVTPPAGSDDAFDADTGLPVVAQLTAILHPRAYGDNDDVTEIFAEDIPVVVAGLVKMGAAFGDETLVTATADMLNYEQGKREMWGRRHNNRAGRVVGDRLSQ